MRSLPSVLASFLILAAVGCGGSGLTPLSGKVTLDGQPLTGASGTVMFVPAGSGAAGTAVIKPDGTYQAMTGGQPGLQPGEYEVAVFANEPMKTDLGTNYAAPKSLIHEKFRDAKTSGLKVKVDGGMQSFDIPVTKP